MTKPSVFLFKVWSFEKYFLTLKEILGQIGHQDTVVPPNNFSIYSTIVLPSISETPKALMDRSSCLYAGSNATSWHNLMNLVLSVCEEKNSASLKDNFARNLPVCSNCFITTNICKQIRYIPTLFLRQSYRKDNI